MTSAASLYHSVINDVISSVRDSFLDEAVDENVLQELKSLWENKLAASKTIDPPARASEALLDARMASARMADATRASLASGRPQPSAVPNTQQLVITDPNRLMPVQITIPPQPGNPASQPRALTVKVPAHALQQGTPTSQLLQQVLTQAISPALNLPQENAEGHLQSQINQAFNLR